MKILFVDLEYYLIKIITFFLLYFYSQFRIFKEKFSIIPVCQEVKTLQKRLKGWNRYLIKNPSCLFIIL